MFLSSHNLDEVERVCSYVGLLPKGELLALIKPKTWEINFFKPNLNITTTDAVQSDFLGRELNKFDFVKSFKIEGNKTQILLNEETDAAKVITFLAQKVVSILEAISKSVLQ